ncbi:MAG: protein-methionine-sulfoxide reductase catalytic subunit MsrP [Rhodocyclaceae bacterium]|nr:protein-methionine-sulfoxide reductase catalytic subunit MsrP [Rhodocyclaceae bacterium]
MLIKRPDDFVPSEITSRAVYEGRREFLRSAGLGAAAVLASSLLPARLARAATAPRFPGLVSSPYSTRDEKLTPFKNVTGYNNYYEFGYEKEDPPANAHRLKTHPWALTVDGLVAKPRTFSIEDLLRLAPMEERIYRMRCVEGWSMLIPWVGFPISALLKQVEPLGSARYVAFQTRLDKETMTGTRLPYLNWPYSEGLRLDEALHPLAILALGLYGDILPNQNGAPVRLVVPWKYGFKGAKSLVRITLTEKQPATAWNQSQPGEYGFYANVNPTVDHPRWSQAKERRLGEFQRRPTLMFNGYGDQVAQLYAGMDLRKNF